jgi:enoyl-CoA hydratase/carnithine racemase
MSSSGPETLAMPETNSPVTLDVDEAGGVAAITLNRPDRLNAINLVMRDLLWSYLEACRDWPEVRVIVFRAAGRAFSAGADISEFGTTETVIEARRARRERDLWSALATHRCHTIALVHGFCYGAGLELPLLCDWRIAVEGATFALPEVTLGYMPSAGGTQTLPRVVPAGIAAHMILTGEPIGCDAALRWGLVDRVVAQGAAGQALSVTINAALAWPPSRPRRRVA